MIQVLNLKKSFGNPSTEVLKGISFTIDSGSFVSITGRSGSGKSTLLYLISTLDTPSSGKVILDNVDISTMSDDQLHRFRNQRMGFVFQFHYLLPELSALENILMPTWKTHQTQNRTDRAHELMSQFGLRGKAGRLPKELSGGEQQRVAIARALILEPQFIFADEPTGNLDSENGDNVMKMFKEITRNTKTTVIYVTHDAEYAAMADRKIHLIDGMLADLRQ